MIGGLLNEGLSLYRKLFLLYSIVRLVHTRQMYDEIYKSNNKIYGVKKNAGKKTELNAP